MEEPPVYFPETDKISGLLFTEEEFVNLLSEIGIKKNVAKVIVFLTGTPVSTSRDIKHGTDMRQSEVSIAIKYLTEQGWIKSLKIPSDRKGRPMKNYSLAVPVKEIIDIFEKTMTNEANDRLVLIRKMREYL